MHCMLPSASKDRVWFSSMHLIKCPKIGLDPQPQHQQSTATTSCHSQNGWMAASCGTTLCNSCTLGLAMVRDGHPDRPAGQALTEYCRSSRHIVILPAHITPYSNPEKVHKGPTLTHTNLHHHPSPRGRCLPKTPHPQVTPCL